MVLLQMMGAAALTINIHDALGETRCNQSFSLYSNIYELVAKYQPLVLLQIAMHKAFSCQLYYG
jgi:hypothetical protein